MVGSIVNSIVPASTITFLSAETVAIRPLTWGAISTILPAIAAWLLEGVRVRNPAINQTANVMPINKTANRVNIFLGITLNLKMSK